MMPDWGKALSTAFAKSLENGGSCGSSGSPTEKSRNNNALQCASLRTTDKIEVVPVVLGAGQEPLRTTAIQPVVLVGQVKKALENKGFKDVGTTGTTRTTEIDEQNNFEERAALIEDGTGAPRAWCEGFARLNVRQPPAGFSVKRWEVVLNDGGLFLDRWARPAARLGWSAVDVFGVYPAAPFARLEAMGLALLIGGGEITAITQQTATIRSPNGAELRYWRRPHVSAVPVWELMVDQDKGSAA